MNARSCLLLCLFSFSLFCEPTAFAKEDGEARQLSAAVQPFAERNELAGAVMLVADKDRVLALESVGFADVENQKPMADDSIFWIASQSKPITAAAVMMLVDEAFISLDDAVEKHLPEFASQMVVAEKSDSGDRVILQKPNRPITVRDILSHTSGLPFKSALEEPTLDLYALSARVRSYAMTPLDHQPGTFYRYSNAGINTAARIIEVVSKESFEDFLDERLFGPLGMKDTTFWPSEEQLARIAKSYRPGPDKAGLEALEITQLHYPLIDRQRRFPMPAGGLFSTAEDIARFYQMLLNGGELNGKRYLSAAGVAQLTSKQTPDEIESGYGFGFAVSPSGWGHGGAYSTNTSVDTQTGLILVWLVQHAGFPGGGKDSQNEFRKAALKAFSESP